MARAVAPVSKARQGRLEVPRDAKLLEEPADSVEASHVEQRGNDHAHRQSGQRDQQHGIVELQAGHNRKQRLERGADAKDVPADQSEDAVGDRAGDERRHEGLGLQVLVAVEDLDGEDRPGQRRLEDGGNAGAKAGRQKDSPLRLRELEQRAEVGAKAGADLRDGAFAPARATRADGQGGADDLDQGHDGADQAPALVVGLDGSVGTVAFGLGRQRVDDHAREQSAQRDHHQDQPGTKAAKERLDVLEEAPFPGRRGRTVAGDPLEPVLHDQVRQELKRHRSQPGDSADQPGQDDQPADRPQVPRLDRQQTQAFQEFSHLLLRSMDGGIIVEMTEKGDTHP